VNASACTCLLKAQVVATVKSIFPQLSKNGTDATIAKLAKRLQCGALKWFVETLF